MEPVLFVVGIWALGAIGSLFDRTLRRSRPEGVALIAPAVVMGGMALAKGLGSLFGSCGKDKAAKTQAENQNAANQWKYKLDKSTYSTEKVPTLKRAQRSSAFRRQLQASIMNNPKYGLAALFPGFAQLQQSFAPKDIVNPYDVAGAPPKAAAATMGTLGNVGAGLAGAADGAAQGMSMAGDMKTLGWVK